MKGEESSKTPVDGWLLAASFLAVVAGAAGLAVGRWLPPLASEHGGGIDRMIHYLVVTTGIVFVVGHFTLAYFVWRFSRQPRVTSWMVRPKVEGVWALVAALLMAFIAEGGVLVLGLPVWGKLYASRPPAEALTVEVTAEQFIWNVRYPGSDGVFGRTDPVQFALGNPVGIDRQDPQAGDDVVLMGEVRVPVNQPVRLRLRSKDTLHSLFLPHQRIKQDLVPGMTIEIWFVPTTTGTYEMACAELCGLGHYQMRGLLYVVSQQEFQEWLRTQPTFGST